MSFLGNCQLEISTPGSNSNIRVIPYTQLSLCECLAGGPQATGVARENILLRGLVSRETVFNYGFRLVTHDRIYKFYAINELEQLFWVRIFNKLIKMVQEEIPISQKNPFEYRQTSPCNDISRMNQRSSGGNFRQHNN